MVTPFLDSAMAEARRTVRRRSAIEIAVYGACWALALVTSEFVLFYGIALGITLSISISRYKAASAPKGRT